ncbi:mediator complex subunit MED14-domain-containing protein [Cunninghamella echinulata]|nr:mediator complex subunit MED14-domain-containing protein [Cunninghamella echinulata]
MHPVSPMDQSPALKEINGHGKQPHEENGINYKMENIKHEKQLTNTMNGDNASSDKIVLPVEMAGMVPLRTLIGKMINKAHADLMTLTDTLPSMSDIERRRRILLYTTSTRSQFLKLTALVKWAENADNIQMCQNIMAFLANQNQVFQETVNYLHKNHVDLPRARVREFDIKTAIDILTTGTYQRMPTKFQDMLPPPPLTDKEVLETFEKLNDVLRVRMLTTEALPSPMRKYKIENGRVYFSIENEFKVALTLMGKSDERKWWIVSLDILVHPAIGGSAADVDISLNDYQKQRLRANAQRQLVPPTSQTTENESSVTDLNSNVNNITTTNITSSNESNSTPLFFPLINLYDYLHLFCLNMQLEIIYMQATMMAKSLWLDQLKIHMDSSRSNLTLVYWGGGSPAAQWGCPQVQNQDDPQLKSRSTSIEISINNVDHKQKGSMSTNNDLRIAVRDELKGLIQKSGIGVSVSLANLNDVDKVKVYSSLKYPKTCLEVTWCGSSNLHTNKILLDSSNLTVERLLLHITQYHKKSILKKLYKLLKSQAKFLVENGVYLIEADDANSIEDDEDKEQPLIIQYRHDLCINIDFDSRTGRIKICETSRSDSDGDEVRLRGLEDRINSDPTNISRHLVWLRSEVVFHEIVSLAKQLNLQAFHPSQMLLRPEDMVKLFGDLPTTLPDPPEVQERNKNLQPSTPRRTATEQPQQPSKKPLYPRHCAFLQFSQFEDWYLVIAVIRNEFQSSLCCLK